ncbi:RNA-binding domain-containing protein [Hesseltinella vesiculosa]|uniref:RNA-binding domain-containing protein n=1 Tax=Hesseltinella vesiculosa TaxID=101127 RepID=A0A1X2GNF5_9FUNG|nr:RNA-binding domain-containing protein [Hesseltinella vesiculosa]
MADAKKLTKKEKKAQAFRDKKKQKLTIDEETAVPAADNDQEEQAQDQPVSTKKRSIEQTEQDTSSEQQQQPMKKKRQRGKKSNGQQHRYTVFVGNLPFDTTADELAKHFDSVGGKVSVRLSTDKITKKPKGFAFVDFESSAQLQKALHYHHTAFKKRKINVELTAGGGGKSDARKEKIKTKNERLEEERKKNSEAGESTTKEEAVSSYGQEDNDY